MKKQSSKNIAFLLVALAILAVYMYYIRPVSDDLDAKNLQVAQLQQELSDLQNKVDKLDSLKAETPEGIAERQMLLSQIPDAVGQDGLIKDMNRLAKSRGIELKNIGFSLQGVDQESGIGTMTMSTGFEGTYEDLINLLADMENNVRKLTVKTISVQVLEVSRDLSADVSFTLTIEAYYQG